ncbi:thiamine pyrophosphate-dependent enzyme [Tepidiforma flava]|uniref:Thiamine pyrophosphate-dependent enzyme n=1 Tax=Tepidiforma flava TaxID=3004094 RepID=A0ABY7M7J4_9CHLR|nr:thiamine pyrophosphate-dependent enzyme [Tepidiforma flava]WBL36257.1 thiamine pyrophosphate-dependent enzyme [Tepidiforma flava]
MGLGVAAQMKREDFVTLCIFGDGSVGEGEFHEALNMAVLWNTPTIFFCENNLYGMGVPFKASLSTEIPKLAAAYNMPAVSVDGMDVLAVYAATREAVAHARAGKGPYFIEAMTYRYRGHSMADPELYRLKEEIEEAKQRDCIERLKRQMMEAGMLDEQGFAEIDARATAVVDEAVEFSERSPQPALDTLFDHLYKE